MLHKVSKLFKAHLSMLGPMVTVMLWKILTRRNSKGLKQIEPLKQPYLQKRGKKKGRERERESMSEKKKER